MEALTVIPPIDLIIAQQGIGGSFHDILRSHEYPGSQVIMCERFSEVVDEVRSGEADMGLMAIENTIHGTTLGDTEVWFNFDDMRKFRESDLDITQKLLGKKNAEIREILSHPAAISQCGWNRLRLYPDAKVIQWDDTASAAVFVADQIAQGNDHYAGYSER